MGAGKLLMAYAYEVAPRQLGPFVGGEITPSPQLQETLDMTFERSSVESAPAVTFEVDTISGSRAHPVRDAAIAIAFEGANPKDAAQGLAARLAGVMDNRSKSSLLMISAHESDSPAERRLLLWTFPQEEVFRLNSTSAETNLELSEAFSRDSRLRKAAFLRGTNPKSGMLTARVRDFQASSSERALADFWIVKFLASRLQMGAIEGTNLLARALRDAHSKLKNDSSAQDQIVGAISAVRSVPKRRWSIASVSETFLSGDAEVAFKDSVRAEEQTVMFDVDIDRFDRLLQYQRFTLNNGVVVSAPFLEVREDSELTVSEINGRRRLRVEGDIEEEQVRSRA